MENHPTLELHSTSVRRRGDDRQVDGDLTIRGVARPITLDLEFEGAMQDPWALTRIGCSATTEVDCEDSGLTWNQALGSGGFLVGKQVRIELSVEAARKDA